MHTPFLLEPARRPLRTELVLSDGYRTCLYVHRARAAVGRAPVLYLHGIQSHPGWFFASAAYLADRGHDVFQVTRRGSGENTVARGHAASHRLLLDDVDRACLLVRQQTGSPRLHMVGVSWGGKLAAAWACSPARQRMLASLTLIAPGIVPLVDAPALTKLGVALSLLCRPRRSFQIPLNDPELFTDNPVMRDFLRHDPLRLHRATARFLWASRRLDGVLGRSAACCQAVPAALVLARRDRIIDNAATTAVVRRLTGGRCEVHELDGAHTLEFEADPAPFHAVLGSFLAGVEAGGAGTENPAAGTNQE